MATELTIEYHDNIYRIHTYPVRIGHAIDNDIVVKNPLVADYHASIEQEGEKYIVHSLKPSYANGKRLPAKQPLENNTQLQIGTANLNLWCNAERIMPSAASKQGGWNIITHPIAVLCWLIAAIMLPMWQGYLDSPQSYIVDYQRLITLIIVLVGLTWVTHSMLLPLSRRYIILPLLGIICAYSTCIDLVSAAADWYGFQFNNNYADTCATILSFVAFFWLYRAFLKTFIPLSGQPLRRTTLLTLLPTLLLVSYSYLHDHNFFSQRPGSYPIYQDKLQSSVLIESNIKSIETFFSIDKNKQKN